MRRKWTEQILRHEGLLEIISGEKVDRKKKTEKDHDYDTSVR